MEFSGIGAEIAIFYPVKLQIISKGIRCILLDCDHSERFFDATLSLNIGKSKLCCPHLLLAWKWNHHSQKCHGFWICCTVLFSLKSCHMIIAWEVPSIVYFHTVFCCV